MPTSAYLVVTCFNYLEHPFCSSLWTSSPTMCSHIWNDHLVKAQLIDDYMWCYDRKRVIDYQLFSLFRIRKSTIIDDIRPYETCGVKLHHDLRPTLWNQERMDYLCLTLPLDVRRRLNILGIHRTKTRLDHGSNMANKTILVLRGSNSSTSASTVEINVKQKFACDLESGDHLIPR